MTSEPSAVELPCTSEIAAVATAAGVADAQDLRWTIEVISHQRIIDTTGGLYEVRGYSGEFESEPSWSCVLKVLQRSEGSECDAPDSWCYWRRCPSCPRRPAGRRWLGRCPTAAWFARVRW